MSAIYFDNAATTKLDPAVLEAMMPYLTSHYGNPSSVHAIGREARIAIEKARKKIVSLLGVRAGNIIFTSCGTESNNTAIRTAIRDLGCDHIITSRIEHHAVLHPVEHCANDFRVGISYVNLTEDGYVDHDALKKLLDRLSASGKKCFVSLMHANNETGNLSEIRWISNLCKRYGAIFHSDCVQTIGHYPLNLAVEGVHMASASAHKFHGPKGIGFLYVHEDLHPSPLMYGGGQERGYRAGTENVAHIVGMAKALEIAYENARVDQQYVGNLKAYLAGFFKTYFGGCIINSGRSSLYSLLSVSFPKTEQTEFLLMELDQRGICVSGGSACSGGGSHVMKELGRTEQYTTIRFSLSKYNTKEEVDNVVEALLQIMEMNTVLINH